MYTGCGKLCYVLCYLRDCRVLEYFVMLCAIYVTVECLSTLSCYVVFTWLTSAWVFCCVVFTWLTSTLVFCYVVFTWLTSAWVLCYVMWCLRDWRVLEYFVVWCLRDWRVLEYFVMWYLRDWRVLEYFVMLCGVNVTVECLISVIELQEGFLIVHVLLPSLSSWQYLKNRIKLISKDQIVL